MRCGDIYDGDLYGTFCGSHGLAELLASTIMWLGPYFAWPALLLFAVFSTAALISILCGIPQYNDEMPYSRAAWKSAFQLIWVSLFCWGSLALWWSDMPAHFWSTGITSLIVIGVIAAFVAIVTYASNPTRRDQSQ